MNNATAGVSWVSPKANEVHKASATKFNKQILKL